MLGLCFFSLGVLFYVIGFIQLVYPAPDRLGRRLPASRLPGSSPAMQRSEPRAAADHRSTNTGADPPAGGETMLSEPQMFHEIEVDQRIFVQHPVRGELMAHVLGRFLYAELWQRSRGAQVPWVPTGNVFLGFWLEGDMFLLNWQNRVYLLDESDELSDADIQRHFASHARKFAQSDQIEDVYFAYPPASWHIDDIGKFRVENTEGERLKFRAGAIGRFIHASGDGSRALVVEDYEGGGQDKAWIGYLITKEQVRPA